MNRHELSDNAGGKEIGRAGVRGMVLASVLLAMGVVIGIVVHLQITALLALRHAERGLLAAQLRLAASESAWSALAGLASTADMLVNHTNESWASPVHRLLPNGIRTEVSIKDEQRLFDLNNLAVALGDEGVRPALAIAEELLEHGGGSDPRDKALALNAWFHSSDRQSNQVISGSLGVERLVESPNELGRILDVDLENSAILSVMTVIPYDRTRAFPVNVNTASPAVLRAVIGGQDDEAVSAISRFRASNPLTALQQVRHLIGEERMQTCGIYLDVKSHFFSIHAQASKNGSSVFLYALARRNEDAEFELIRWVLQ